MARKKSNIEKRDQRNKETENGTRLHPEIKKNIWLLVFLGMTFIFILAAADQAGPAGRFLYDFFTKLFGWGYYFLPIISFLIAFSLAAATQKDFLGVSLIGGGLFLLSGLGFIDLVAPGSGGLTGSLIGLLKVPFGLPSALVITSFLIVIAFLLMVNRPLNWAFLSKFKPSFFGAASDGDDFEKDNNQEEEKISKSVALAEKPTDAKVEDLKINLPLGNSENKKEEAEKNWKMKTPKNYVLPPLSLLVSSVEKPTFGDLRANANIIKRTLESFGLAVEMGEINVGPTFTRYTLKPAEGIKLSRILALSQDLALAMAAHPIRIEAPIPGKSLVGIEVPNKSAAVVRLGTLLHYPDFQKSGLLSFALGRDVSGDPLFIDIAKMPHLLIAGATGSGKSISIHSLLISLLYKNSPESLRLIMIDPKKVELSIYSGLPHLILPVVTENKKAIVVLRWLIQEMENRYQKLLEAGSRDIKSYNQDNSKDAMPYIVVVIDELADLMASFGREVEGAIIRLAQMARATGIHLIVSTQRPSVEVITGLIKANITSRIALQVASQIDSRTILDTGGAEKLLGHGDLLFASSEMSKPRRLQGSFLTEDEIKGVIKFINENNAAEYENFNIETASGNGSAFDLNSMDNDEDDELYPEAVEVVRAAGKASASLLQRRLKVGYARAARLLDIMEAKGVVGPGDGAKPREVYGIDTQEGLDAI
ncbi:MAG: DNA translocase FtsK [bacterium]|nr:DNA translocase FtsK [bacterium]